MASELPARLPAQVLVMAGALMADGHEENYLGARRRQEETTSVRAVD